MNLQPNITVLIPRAVIIILAFLAIPENAAECIIRMLYMRYDDNDDVFDVARA